MANIFQRLFNYPKQSVGTEENYRENYIPNIISGNSFSDKNATNISSVFTCIKILSDTLSRLPLNVYQLTQEEGRVVDKQDYRYPILHYSPNSYTTSQSFVAALEYYRNLHGNAFARIKRNVGTGAIESLEILPSGRVIGYNKVNGELYYLLYKKDGGAEEREVVSANDILHFKMVTKDGIWGVSPIEALRLNLSTSYKGLTSIDKFYENNAISPKALKSVIPDAAYRAKQKEAVEDFKLKYAGPKNAGEMIILPEYTEIQELSLSMADAEFIETIKFNSQQIAAVYGVPTHLVTGDPTASKFNNVEQLALNFKTNTMDAIARMYRQEMESKLLSMTERENGKSIEFNFMAFVEVDHKSRFEGYKTLFSMGVITPNEIAKLEGIPAFPTGNYHYVPANFVSIESKEVSKVEPKIEEVDDTPETDI